MVKNQLIPHHVHNEELLKAMHNVKRHFYVPSEWKEVAYLDRRIPANENREILDPNTQARMIQSLEVKSTDSVLDIGCGFGYSSAILSKLAKRVVALENDESLVEDAKKHTKSNNKIHVMLNKNLQYGYEGEGEYNCILVNGIAGDIRHLRSLLKKNGRLVCMEYCEGVIWAVLYKEIGGDYSREELFNANAKEIF